MCDQQEMKAQSCLKEELAGVKGLTLVKFGDSGDCCREAATGKSQDSLRGLGGKEEQPASSTVTPAGATQADTGGCAKPWASDYFVNCCPKSWAPNETLINLYQ